ncbi:MAG: hypothetical protein M3Y78_08240 [Pseudomonadota bacterium]|nr:hypothetical protein [Pseudomonadota bacterium]
MAAAGAKKKPARTFQVPAGVAYGWKQRRYVKSMATKTVAVRIMQQLDRIDFSMLP